MDTEKKETASKAKWIIRISVFAVMTGLCAWHEKIFSQPTAAETMGAISNTFLVPGVVYAGLGALDWGRQRGIFDGLGYAVGKYGLHNLIPGVNTLSEYKDYYEYVTAKQEKRTTWSKEMLFMGFGALAVSVIAAVIYGLLA